MKLVEAGPRTHEALGPPYYKVIQQRLWPAGQPGAERGWPQVSRKTAATPDAWWV